MMTKWHAKELSKLTDISVQTLHHYDRIGLLEPSLRQANGYRVYLEKDLLQLQQIIALKFFGFKLNQIKSMLSGKVDIMANFTIQADYLAEKSKQLSQASKNLKEIAANNKSPNWESIIKMIGVYRMTEKLEKSWISKALTAEELKQYAEFESECKDKKDKQAFDKAWANLVLQINANLESDPKSDIGFELAKNCMNLINDLYGKKYAHLKHSIWEKGFKGGHMEKEHLLTKESVSWLDQATDAYYRKRLYSILNRVGAEDNSELRLQWDQMMDEMFGNSIELKKNLRNIALADEKVSNIAKTWLKENY